MGGGVLDIMGRRGGVVDSTTADDIVDFEAW